MCSMRLFLRSSLPRPMEIISLAVSKASTKEPVPVSTPDSVSAATSVFAKTPASIATSVFATASVSTAISALLLVSVAPSGSKAPAIPISAFTSASAFATNPSASCLLQQMSSSCAAMPKARAFITRSFLSSAATSRNTSRRSSGSFSGNFEAHSIQEIPGESTYSANAISSNSSGFSRRYKSK